VLLLLGLPSTGSRYLTKRRTGRSTFDLYELHALNRAIHTASIHMHPDRGGVRWRSACSRWPRSGTLLINIPDPAAVVAEMVRLARPGGWIAVLEPDGGESVCYPAHPAWDRLTEIFFSAQEVDAADTFIGRRLPELLRHAGLIDIGVEAKADIYPAGHSRRTIRADLVRSMRAKVMTAGIAGEK
jgi:SAM-dependent methyltransferase